MYKSGFDPTVNVRLRHSFNGGHYRRGGLDSVKGDGTIAYRFVGPIGEESYREVILPEIEKALR